MRVLALLALLLSATAALAQEDVADLASATVGDSKILPVAEHASVASVVSFVLDHVAPEATSALALPELDRAALLRAENALARMGRPAVLALAAALEGARGARLQVISRALGRAAVASVTDAETAHAGARALAAHPTVLVREHLLFSGMTSEPALDDELLPSLLGKLAPDAIDVLAALLESPETRSLGVRALAHAQTLRDEAAATLGKLMAKTQDPVLRRQVGRALSDLGGEGSVLALEAAIALGPESEHHDRILDIEHTLDPGVAARALARKLDRFSPVDKARALEAIAIVSQPPPPPPKARFVFDPFAKRRSKDARLARAEGRAACLASLKDEPVLVRRAAARALETLERPEVQKDQQTLAHKLLEAFEEEPVLSVACEEARALTVLTPAEVLVAPFRAALDRVLARRPEPALAALGLGDAALPLAPRVSVDFASRDRFVHAVLNVLGDEEGDLAPLARIVQETGLDPSCRARAAAGLGRLGALGRSRLDELARSDDEITRACALAARAGALPPEQSDLLFRGNALGRSRSALERRANVLILAYAAGPGARGMVQGISRNDPSPLVRLAGTEAIARAYGRDASNTLAQALFDGSLAVRRAAARALARIQDPNTGGSICQAIARAKKLQDRDQGEEEERFLRAALPMLGRDAVPSIGNIAVNAGDPLERRVAMAQLGRIKTDEAIAYLIVIVRGKQGEDRDAGVWALETATGRDLTDSMWVPLRPAAH